MYSNLSYLLYMHVCVFVNGTCAHSVSLSFHFRKCIGLSVCQSIRILFVRCLLIMHVHICDLMRLDMSYASPASILVLGCLVAWTIIFHTPYHQGMLTPLVSIKPKPMSCVFRVFRNGPSSSRKKKERKKELVYTLTHGPMI